MKSETAQPKPESWQKIAREAAGIIVPNLKGWLMLRSDVEAIILSAIERSHAAQPQSRKAMPEQPQWACSRWGGYGHDWLACPDCLEAYDKQNEAAQPQPSKASPLTDEKPKRRETDIDGYPISSQHENGGWMNEDQKASTESDVKASPLCERSEQDDPEGFIPAWHLGDTDEAARSQRSEEEQEDIDLGRVPPDLGCKPVSDQPSGSGRTTDDKQEWTHEKLQGLLGISNEDRYVADHAFENTLDEINAELAAECQRREQAEQKNKAQANTFHLLGDALGINPQNEFTEELFVAVANLKGQLLSALAAIEKVEHENIVGNLSPEALVKHDAEVRKPLVDDKRRMDWLDEHFRPHFKHIIPKAHVSDLSPFKEQTKTVRQAIDDALAKVKEGQ